MMRYQRHSPDYLPVTNGRKPPSSRTCKEDDSDNGIITNCNGFEGKPHRFRPPSSSQDHNFTGFSAADLLQPESRLIAKLQGYPESGSGVDVLLQWGQKKRSRMPRAENRSVADETSSQAKQAAKMQRRLDKKTSAAMSPPPSVASLLTRASLADNTLSSRSISDIVASAHARETTSASFGCTLSKRSIADQRPSLPAREAASGSLGCILSSRSVADMVASVPARGTTSASLRCRNIEDRSSLGNMPQSSNGNGRLHSRSAEKRSPQSPEKMDKTTSCSAAAPPISEKLKGVTTVQPETMNVESVPQPEPDAGVAAEKLNLDLFEWPRIYISLSRKEKEDDFFAIKGTKLPQRPKKRAKNVDKNLQFCFPGMWLSDLSRARYEVREKKCVKKRRRGLKGMESMDSESE